MITTIIESLDDLSHEQRGVRCGLFPHGNEILPSMVPDDTILKWGLPTMAEQIQYQIGRLVLWGIGLNQVK